jgi:integrase
VARADIASCLAAVRKNSGAVTANRVRTSLSTFFSWVMGEGLREDNPVIGTNRNEEKSRDRVLPPSELRLIWNNLEDDDYGAIIKLSMLTGQRAGEIAGLQRPEVDSEKDLISLPGDRTKNHRPHTVPMSAPARAIIAARPERVGPDGKLRELLFGLGEGPFSGWSNCKERLDERIAKAAGKPLAHWTPHDLRRSFTTHAAELGIIQPHIIEAILNHVSGHRGGVAGIYNRATYEPEKRTGLAKWAEQLLAWVEGRDSNIVALSRSA